MSTTISRTARPLLGALLPVPRLEPDEGQLLATLQHVLDNEIEPRATTADSDGRYPTGSIDALRRTGILASALPRELGGLDASHRFSLEAQMRIASADSSVAQIFKVHDELVREILVYAPDGLAETLAARIVDRGSILGLAVAERGRKADDPLTTVALRQADGAVLIDGVKIYTTGAAEADLIAVWAFDPEAGAEDWMRGMQLNLVPRDTPGVHVHRDWDALGQRATDSGSVSFDGVRVDPALRANDPDRWPVLHSPVRYQAGFAAVLVGIGVAALATAVRFVATSSRPWPAAGVDEAVDDPLVSRLAGELGADLAAAHALTLATGDLLDAADRGELGRTEVAVPIYAAKAAASRAAVRASNEVFALMGTRSVQRVHGLDRFWRNARTLSLHDPVDWKHQEIGRHLLTGWDPPFGVYT